MTDVYACSRLVGNVCVEWVKTNNGSSFLPNLTLEQVWQIFIATALLFATAWVFRELPAFIKRL